MEKSMQNIGKKALLYLKEDLVEEKELKLKLKSIDNKVQQMLLWSTLCSVWSYLVLIITIARIYASYKGTHTLLLTSCLLLIYVLMGVLIYFAWKRMNYKRKYFYYASKTYLKYQIGKLAAQRKLIALYLLEYVLLIGVASIFFSVNIRHGGNFLLKITTPVSIITIGLGFYFIANFTKQIKGLQLLHSQLNQLYVKQFNAN